MLSRMMSSLSLAHVLPQRGRVTWSDLSSASRLKWLLLTPFPLPFGVKAVRLCLVLQRCETFGHLWKRSKKSLTDLHCVQTVVDGGAPHSHRQEELQLVLPQP